MPCSTEFWDALAPHHSLIENNYLDVRSIRRVLQHLRDPVLVVGAGQGLIVEELLGKGFRCQGVDLSPEMVKHARIRRGLTLIHADAKALPFPQRTYETIVYATGVIDFMANDGDISAILNEGRRVLTDSGKLFVAFYKFSAAMEKFLKKTGLLSGQMLAQRETLRLYLLNPVQTLDWVAKSSGVSRLRALGILFGISAFSTVQEKTASLRMRRIFRKLNDPDSLVHAATEKLPYRNETEIRDLLDRLALPVKHIHPSPTCYIVRIQ